MTKSCPQGHLIEGNNAKPYKKDGRQHYTCRQCSRNRAQNLRAKNGEWLPFTTETVMASYKEPLKPVSQGFGYYGTIAYDKTQQYTQCHLCGNFYKTLGSHVSKVHGKTPKQYKTEMGLPTALSLTAPKAKNKNYEQWQNYTAEERAKIIQKMKAGRDNRKMPDKWRKKSLYQRNLEGRCPDQLLDKILQLKEKLGRTPGRREFAQEYNGFLGSVELTFGSWGEALKILGLVPKRAGYISYDKETLLAMLFEFRERYGREPMSSDTGTGAGILPSRHTYANYFGSWSKAKEYVISAKEPTQ